MEDSESHILHPLDSNPPAAPSVIRPTKAVFPMKEGYLLEASSRTDEISLTLGSESGFGVKADGVFRGDVTLCSEEFESFEADFEFFFPLGGIENVEMVANWR